MSSQSMVYGPYLNDPGPDPPDNPDTGSNSGTKTVDDKDADDVQAE